MPRKPKIISSEEEAKIMSISEKNIFPVEEKALPAEEKKSIGIIDKLLEWGICVLVFLFPLFFLPFTSEIIELNKLILLVFFSVVLFLLWLGKIIIQSSIKLVRGPLTPAILFFFLVYLISAIFSKDRYQSFIGFSSSIAESFLAVFALILFYFIVLNNVRTTKIVRCLITGLFFSIFLTALYGFLQLLNIYLFPFWSITKNPVFNTIGAHNALEILLGLGIIFGVLFLLNPKIKFWLKIVIGALSLGLLVFTFLLNFKNVWLGLTISMLLIIGFALFRREPNLSRWLWLPMTLFGLFILFYYLPFQSILKNVPAEIMPSAKATVDIAKATLKQNLLLGSGPGTWVIDYTKFKQSEVNLTNFWNVRFAKGWSYFFMLPATIGLVGVATWLTLIFVFLFTSFKNVFKNEKLVSSRGSLQLAVFAGWFYLLVMQIMYHTNITLQFVFWLLMALLGVLFTIEKETEFLSEKIIKIEFNPSSPLASIFSFVFIITIVGAIIGFYFLGQIYLADIIYAKALQSVQAKSNISESVGLFEKTVSDYYNPRFDLYQRTLSQIYLLYLQQIVRQTSPQDQSQVQHFQSLVDKMINAVKKATQTSPNNAENWIQRARIYQELIGTVQGADDWAIKSFDEAIKLDPADPYLYTEQARIYSVTAANFAKEADKKEEYFSKAETNINEAIRLKPDYGPAYILLSLIYEQEGKTDEAISRLEGLKATLNNDVGLLFQLGYLYYRENQLDKAQIQFERAINLVDNFSNARYFLGLIYDRKGNKQTAIQQFEKILSLNPNSQEVIRVLANLRADQPALQGLGGSQAINLPAEQPEIKPSQPGL